MINNNSTIINKGKIGLGWTIATIYIIHLCIRAVEARGKKESSHGEQC